MILDGLLWALWFVVTWWVGGIVHELFHVIAALAVGCGRQAFETSNVLLIVVERCVVIKGTSKKHSTFIRHSGWIGSTALLLATLACWSCASSDALLDEPVPPGRKAPTLLALAVVTLESCLSDLLGLELSVSQPNLAHAFHCGNFGVIIAGQRNREYVYEILRKMVEVTMM